MHAIIDMLQAVFKVLREMFPLQFFLYQLPEAWLLILAALKLLGRRVVVAPFLLSGLCLGVLTAVSRYYLLPIGVHTPVILIGLILALMLGFKLRLPTAITGCFLSYFLLLIGDTLIVLPALKLTKISLEQAMNNVWLSVGFGWLSASLLIIASLICAVFRIALIRVPEPASSQQKG